MLSSSGYFLSRDDLKEIYAAVDNDHNKLRDFAEILLLSSDTSSFTIDLLKEYCKYTEYDYNYNYHYFNR